MMTYSRPMGADASAVWLGALIVSALSFIPAHMAPTRRARDAAGRWARLSLPLSAGSAAWSTLTLLELTPPPGGVLVSAVELILLVPIGLASWGLALTATAAAEHAVGARIPRVVAVALGLGSVVFMLAAK